MSHSVDFFDPETIYTQPTKLLDIHMYHGGDTMPV